MRIRSRVLMGVGSTIALAGGVLFAAAPANASTVTPNIITPHVSVHEYSAYNYADSYGQVQHYDQTSNGMKTGNWASPGNWSNEYECWVGVTSYWYNFRS